jgi:hypothetical protein
MGAKPPTIALDGSFKATRDRTLTAIRDRSRIKIKVIKVWSRHRVRTIDDRQRAAPAWRPAAKETH